MSFKEIASISIIFLLGITVFAQDISGKWYSKTSNIDKEEHFLFDIRKSENGYSGYLDIPSSNIFRVRLDSVKMITDRSLVHFSHKGLSFFFNGEFTVEQNRIKGLVEKESISDSIYLSRTPLVKRSQRVKEPIPYLRREVFFFNKDSIRFSGTLTIPKIGNNFSAVVMISGSGPQNRDEEILGHKPFKILADYLTRQGIVVLRYDDRGCGKSEGQFRPATSMDYSYDALAAVQFLQEYKDIAIKQLGLIGHSEGGNIAPVAATMDSTLNFIVLLAAPGVSNFDSYLVSLDLILKEYPETYDRDYPFFKSVYTDMVMINDKQILRDSLELKFNRITTLMNEDELLSHNGATSYVKSQVEYHTSDWYHYYLQFDVTPYLEKLKIPILALNGDKDISIESKINLTGIEKTLEKSGISNFELFELKNVNHFFQVSKDSKLATVYFNEVTFSEEALLIIGDWIKKL